MVFSVTLKGPASILIVVPVEFPTKVDKDGLIADTFIIKSEESSVPPLSLITCLITVS